jgi:hypothetical protein
MVPFPCTPDEVTKSHPAKRRRFAVKRDNSSALPDQGVCSGWVKPGQTAKPLTSLDLAVYEKKVRRWAKHLTCPKLPRSQARGSGAARRRAPRRHVVQRANAKAGDSDAGGSSGDEGPAEAGLPVGRSPTPNVFPFPRTGERVNFDAPRGYFTPAEKKFLVDVAEFLAVSANFPPAFDELSNEFSRSLRKLETDLGLEIDGEIIRRKKKPASVQRGAGQ